MQYRDYRDYPPPPPSRLDSPPLPSPEHTPPCVVQQHGPRCGRDARALCGVAGELVLDRLEPVEEQVWGGGGGAVGGSVRFRDVAPHLGRAKVILIRLCFAALACGLFFVLCVETSKLEQAASQVRVQPTVNL